jgi:hypothetical protein
MTNPKLFFRMSDTDNILSYQYLETWRSGMRNVQSTAPAANPIIAVLAAADLLEETIRGEAFKDSHGARDICLSHLDSIRRRIWEVKRNATP